MRIIITKSFILLNGGIFQIENKGANHLINF